eukprot:366402-Chlamydomonas_euryale.AAC.14
MLLLLLRLEQVLGARGRIVRASQQWLLLLALPLLCGGHAASMQSEGRHAQSGVASRCWHRVCVCVCFGAGVVEHNSGSSNERRRGCL